MQNLEVKHPFLIKIGPKLPDFAPKTGKSKLNSSNKRNWHNSCIVTVNRARNVKHDVVLKAIVPQPQTASQAAMDKDPTA